MKFHFKHLLSVIYFARWKNENVIHGLHQPYFPILINQLHNSYWCCGWFSFHTLKIPIFFLHSEVEKTQLSELIVRPSYTFLPLCTVNCYYFTPQMSSRPWFFFSFYTIWLKTFCLSLSFFLSFSLFLSLSISLCLAFVHWKQNFVAIYLNILMSITFYIHRSINIHIHVLINFLHMSINLITYLSHYQFNWT